MTAERLRSGIRQNSVHCERNSGEFRYRRRALARAYNAGRSALTTMQSHWLVQ